MSSAIPFRVPLELLTALPPTAVLWTEAHASATIPPMSEPAAEITDGRVLRARARRTERRAQILRASRRVFAAKSYHTASIQDILEEAGIARGTFYGHFDSKRLVFEALLDQLLTEVQGQIRGVDLSSEVPPQKQLSQTIQNVLGVLVENEDLTTILLRQAVGLDDEFDQKLSEFYGRVRLIIAKSLKIGMDIGLVRELDAAVVSTCMLGTVKEVMTATLLDRQPGFPNIEVLTNELLSLNLIGVMR